MLEDRHWAPVTFKERGAAVPFTSPMLAGARVRLTERRHDLIVPHPGGARGVYIFTLASLGEFCTPSLHDLQLVERLGLQNALSPACVRQVARGVAAEGAAGRAAASAASATEASDRQSRSAFEHWLLAPLADEAEDHAPFLEQPQRTDQAVCRLASRTGRMPEAVRADIDLLTAQLAASGLAPPGADARASRVTVLLDRMAALAQQLRAARAVLGESAALARVADAAEAVAMAGRVVHAQAQDLLADPASLLAAWATSPARFADRIGRPSWLLDGWEHISLLWHVAETDAQRLEAAAEACALTPPMPAEAEAWLDSVPALWRGLCVPPGAAAAPRNAGRVPSQAVTLVARNERIRALAA